MRYIDITHTIADGMKKYPSDPEVEVKPFKSIGKGNSCNLARLAFGSHVATHIDAPRHVSRFGSGVDRISLDRLMCKVLVAEKDRFFEKARHDKKIKGISGIIFKKGSGRAELTVEEAKALLRNNITLIGTEGLSIEEPSDRFHPVHRLLLQKRIVIVENLNLAGVRPGRYRLICLPLKIKDGDGAPVRAVLISD